MPTSIATGFDFQPLLDGNILVEFQDDDGKTFKADSSQAKRSVTFRWW